jgi:hypothetical protein
LLRRRCITLLVLAVPLTGCQSFGSNETIAIVNNSGRQIIVTAGETTVVAFPGRSVETAYPDPDALSGGKVRVETSLCRLQYQLPLESDDYPWKEKANGELALQLESDFKLYAIPPASRAPMRLTSFARLQRGQFPIAPQAMHCGPPDEDE